MRKTDYREKYCKEILTYFERALEDRHPNGIVKKYPSFVGFARQIGVTVRTVENWRKAHPRFDEACEMCAELTIEALIDNGLSFKAHASFAKFLLSSRYGMRERVEITNDNDDITITKEMEELIRQREKRGQNETK